ncbi:hypothetical protein BDR26DRAFT_282969 [Obelidium mucronatum]|nr:hypothetical protein BDR26DRAFT_282969 [Obelidium mucronatum]
MEPSASLDRKTLLRMLVESPLPSTASTQPETQTPPVSLRTPATIDATESLTDLLAKLKGFASDEDPAATEGIWRLCTKAKSALPSGDRLENLSWRLLHMSLRKKKEKEAAGGEPRQAPQPCFDRGPKARNCGNYSWGL